jgi:hypothetical protein
LKAWQTGATIYGAQHKADEWLVKEKAHQILVGFTIFSSGNDIVALCVGTISLQSMQNYGASLNQRPA